MLLVLVIASTVVVTTLATRMTDPTPKPTAAAAAFGRLDPFDETTDDWSQYQERMAFYFEANGITDGNQKRAIFLTAVGASTYQRLRNLVAPAKPGEKTFQELCDILTTHHNPKPAVPLQRFRFNSRVQHPGESVASFVVALRGLSEHCEFGETLEAMLRDRLVCGIADERVQRRLLSERELPFPKALDIAKAMESAGKDTEEMKAMRFGYDSEDEEKRERHKR